jgi:hypothetical protein
LSKVLANIFLSSCRTGADVALLFMSRGHSRVRWAMPIAMGLCRFPACPIRVKSFIFIVAFSCFFTHPGIENQSFILKHCRIDVAWVFRGWASVSVPTLRRANPAFLTGQAQGSPLNCPYYLSSASGAGTRTLPLQYCRIVAFFCFFAHLGVENQSFILKHCRIDVAWVSC